MGKISGIEYLLPGEIEKKSFEIISRELEKRGILLPASEEMITKRAIHTSADFTYATTMTYSDNAVEIAKELLLKGADIVTDTNMALAGINKKALQKLGGCAHCFMADEDVAELARRKGVTRAAVSMEKAAGIDKPVIFAVGNAPTALIRIYEMMQESSFRPAFVIGVPVGFVNVEAAKELIMEAGIPYIVNRGRKGGSNIAAAICNALLYECVCFPKCGKEGTAQREENHLMRHGFTTGSCAAAAAKAAAYMLLTGRKKTEITIETPKGILYKAEILDINCTEREVSCAVEKDGGDDPDVTTGAWIYAKVSYAEDVYIEERGQEILIEGGAGIGRVTKPGLDQPVGNAAINHVPREMIKKEVAEICRLLDYGGSLKVKISVPDGERIAEQTFNPRLGIVGGISILGTSGIVEPMSSQAILDTIKTELNQRRMLGFDCAVISPGNYGLEFMKKTYGYDLDKSVKCSNFIGDTVDMAVELGFRRLLFTGHLGKMIKVAGGIMNTHSKEADCRMELLAAFAVREHVDLKYVCKILDCVTTQEALYLLAESGRLSSVMEYAVERICYYLGKRAGGNLQIDCILYANDFGELAKSKGAEEWFTLLEQDAERQT